MPGAITFDGAPPPGTINLGIGQPSLDLLPVALLQQASEAFFASARPAELNYGVMPGDERFRQSLAGFLSVGYGDPVAPDELFVTGGNSQALDFVCTVFTNAGDTVFVEEPSYFLAFQIFRDHGLNLIGIPVNANGLDFDALESELKRHKPAFFYTIPSYHNPGGQCLSTDHRRRLLELSVKHNFLIVADEVYQLLSYSAAPPPAFATMIGDETVLSLGSFSKILAPGLRLGWIQTAGSLRQRLLTNGFVNSGGSINHFTSHIVRSAIDLGLQSAHIEKLCDHYAARSNAMDNALQAEFGDIANWVRPDGGYFFWVRFDDNIDTSLLREAARNSETGFQPGKVFSSRGELRNYMRLSFAHYNESEIADGIGRLRPLFD